MQHLRTEQDLDALRHATQAYSVLCAWSDAGLFDALRDGEARTADELPGDTRAVATTAPVLGNLGLLVRSEVDGSVTWRLSPTGRKLVRAGVFPIPRALDGVATLSRLGAVMADGGPAPDAEGRRKATSGGVREDDPERNRLFMDSLWRRSAVGAVETARAVADRHAPGRALDLGGGHGRYAAELAERGWEVTIFDRAGIVELARERHADRFGYLAGDFLREDLGGPYEAILLSNIVHGLSDDEIDGLLPRMRAALRPGGLLVLKDMFFDDTGVGPRVPALFGVTMLMYTEGGRSYGVAELRPRLADAGFAHADHLYLPDQSFSLLIAR